MYLTTRGKPQKVPLKLCKQAVKWYGKKLLTDRIYHSISVRIEFNNEELGKDYYAFCDWNDTNYRSKEFTITIDPNLSKRLMLMVLAHEMVHVKQYASGEMKDYLKFSRTKYRGTIYEESELDYWDYPWEIEAHGRERGLYLRFMKFLREKKHDDNKVCRR